MAKRKSFNPFTMWGSYVGLILGFLTFLVLNEKFFLETAIFVMGIFDLGVFGSFPLLVGLLLLGFLIGWGIHSIFRGLKK